MGSLPGDGALIAAATLVLLRELHGRAEVLLVRRHPELKFMGGLWAFPGGRIEAEDHEFARRALAASLVAAGAAPDPDAQQDAAFRIAACRETAEECALVIEPGELLLWSHWITPAGAARRYDTRFFAAQMKSEAAVTLDRRELVDFAWLEPAVAIEHAIAQARPVSPPTHFVLEDLRLSLELHGSLSGALAAERYRQVPAIVPRLHEVGGRREVVMPWEPLYASLAGEGQALEGELPEHIRRLASLANPRLAPVIRIR